MDMMNFITEQYSSLEDLYKHLHANPELSYFEEKTSKRIADELRKAGYQVTEHYGKFSDPKRTSYGVVAVLENGEGPTVLYRTDLDALPVAERTGLPYASKATGKNSENVDVLLMHACGHDIHMTVFIGVARAMMAARNQWKGTLVLIAQPAEEVAPGGAEAMLQNGLYTDFGRPDYCYAFHDSAALPAGKIGWVEGYALAGVDTVEIIVRGAGGHGAYPHSTKDPIVIASQLVMALQTIVSREVPPWEPAVVTIGSIHGGTKHNIIPDEVKLELTVRSYKPEVREILLKAIDRISKGVAHTAGVPPGREPVVNFNSSLFVPATFNNAELVRKNLPVLQSLLGAENVVQVEAVMGGEDFSHYSLSDHSVPCAMYWLGAVDPQKYEHSKKNNLPLPSLHSSEFAPFPEPTIRTGVRAMTTLLLDALK